MQATISNALYLSGEKVSFTGRNGDNVEFQRAEFYVRGGGESANFNVILDIDIDALEELSAYDLIVDMEKVKQGNAYVYKCRIVGLEPSYS